MEKWGFGDGNVVGLMESKRINSSLPDIDRRLQLHSSLVQRLSLEKELEDLIMTYNNDNKSSLKSQCEGHQGCVNTIAWNSKGSLLISGSDDTQINIWRYTNKKLVDSINSGHSANIFCTKFIPETSDEVVVSGAGDAEVRIFNLLRAGGGTSEGNSAEPTAIFRCHSKRVKKLAVEVGNPNLVWSASEDGTLRQHDFRESSCCPPSGSSNRECRNVLLDLRCASKKSLRDSPKQLLALKSCDINMARPHQLLIGGSDAFARLYDRRMLPPLSSSQVKLKPPPCVSYFCPMHLSERRRSSLHLTHVAFSPNGEEMLLSYSGEHVYLMDVNHGTLAPADDQTIMMYTPNDVSNRICLAPISSVLEPSNMTASPNAKCTASRKGVFIRFDMHNKLVKAASKALEDGSNYLYGIEACSEVLDGKGPKFNDVLLHECLCLRAALLLKRKWKNDAHMAIRDCLKARNVEQSSFKAHYYMSEALTQLGRHREALTYAEAAHQLDPSDKNAADRVQDIKTHISADEEKNSKENGEASRSEQQPGRLPSWSDMLFIPEEISDTSQDGPRSEREDSDYDNEMELDFETSISGDEGHDESRILRGSLNLRFHPREETVKENSSSNTSYESSSSACQYDGLCCKPEVAIDMKQRYVGHCNVGTDIKQASFLGQQGEFVASGSDDGRWFIWEKRTGRLVKVLAGDEAVVNCVQCHPFECAVATSGIDNTIKIWTPIAQTASMVAGGTAGPETGDVVSVIEANQEKLCRSQETVLPFEFFERFRMHELAEGSMHPFECAQS